MTCQEFDSLLDAFVNNALPVIDASAMEAHINECPACKIDYAFALKTKKALHSFPVIEAPNDFLANINKRIDEEAGDLYIPKFNLRALLNKKVYPAVAACLAFALLIGTKPWALIKDSGTDIDTPVSTFAPIDEKGKSKTPYKPSTDFAKTDENATEQKPSNRPDTDKKKPAGFPKPNGETPSKPVKDATKATDKPTVKPSDIPTTKPTKLPTEQPTRPTKPTDAPAPVVSEAAVIAEVVVVSEAPTPVEIAPSTEPIVVETNTIALPSDQYVVSDESDNANFAKIQEKSKLEQSYALADSFDGTLFSPDVLAKISQYDNIIIDDPLMIGVDDELTALTVSADDMDSVNKALEVFKFKSNGNKYKIPKEELKQFLNTLQNLGVDYIFDKDSIKDDTIIELITA